MRKFISIYKKKGDHCNCANSHRILLLVGTILQQESDRYYEICCVSGHRFIHSFIRCRNLRGSLEAPEVSWILSHQVSTTHPKCLIRRQASTSNHLGTLQFLQHRICNCLVSTSLDVLPCIVFYGKWPNTNSPFKDKGMDTKIKLILSCINATFLLQIRKFLLRLEAVDWPSAIKLATPSRHTVVNCTMSAE